MYSSRTGEEPRDKIRKAKAKTVNAASDEQVPYKTGHNSQSSKCEFKLVKL